MLPIICQTLENVLGLKSKQKICVHCFLHAYSLMTETDIKQSQWCLCNYRDKWWEGKEHTQWTNNKEPKMAGWDEEKLLWR